MKLPGGHGGNGGFPPAAWGAMAIPAGYERRLGVMANPPQLPLAIWVLQFSIPKYQPHLAKIPSKNPTTPKSTQNPGQRRKPEKAGSQTNQIRKVRSIYIGFWQYLISQILDIYLLFQHFTLFSIYPPPPPIIQIKQIYIEEYIEKT